MICPSISELGGEPTITTSRTTGVIALLRKEPEKAFVNVLYLCLIGVFVQFGWEFSLLVNGIRPMNEASIRTLIVNSCLETNLGMPAIYLIYRLWSRRFHEDLSRAESSVTPPDTQDEDISLPTL